VRELTDTGVPNMPGAAPLNSIYALNNATPALLARIVQEVERPGRGRGAWTSA